MREINNGDSGGRLASACADISLSPFSFSKGGVMGNENGVDGRVNFNHDTEQLRKLISELREKIIKEVALSRFHFEKAFSFEKKMKQCEARLSELKYEPERLDVG